MLGNSVDTEGDSGRGKVVFVGNGAVGKTSLLIAFVNNTFQFDYVPSVFENYSVQHCQDGKEIILHTWDTAGAEEYSRIRPLTYVGADIVILCYSCIDRASFDDIEEFWCHEISHNRPEAEIIIVATKCDRLSNPGGFASWEEGEIIDKEQGLSMAERIGAKRFFECSALTGRGVREIFYYLFERIYHFRFNKHLEEQPVVKVAPKEKHTIKTERSTETVSKETAETSKKKKPACCTS